MLPGDTTFVRGGLYVETSGVRFPRSGTSGGPIKLLNYPGEAPTIDCNRTGASSVLVEHLNGDLVPIGYIAVEGFEIRECYFGIKGSHNYNSTYRRNWIHNNRAQGILINSGKDNLIERNLITFNGGTGSTQNHGIYGNGNRFTIRNNVIYANSCFGIQHNGAKNYDATKHPGREWEESQDWIIANNTIAYQYICSAIVEWGPHADNARIENNIFYENRVNGTNTNSNGIHWTGIGGPTGSLGIQIRNNLVYASGSGGLPFLSSSPNSVEGVNYFLSGNSVNVSNPDFVNGGSNALPNPADFTLTAGSPAINMGRLNEFPKNGSSSDAGAFETVGTPTAAITNNVITLAFPMTVNLPIQVPSSAGVSISCTSNPTACPSSPAVTAAVRRPGTDSLVDVSISGISGNICKTGQDWRISYNSTAGSWADSANIGNYPGLDQKIFSFTNILASNACEQGPPPAATIGNLSPNTLTIQNGQNGTLTVALNATQGSNTVVSLSSSNTGVATVPATVTVPAGQLSVIFTVTSVANGTANITASLNSTSDVTPITVESSPPPPPAPAVVSLLPSTVSVNTAATVNLTININAAQGTNTSVVLSSSNPAVASVPASATVLSGNTSVVAMVSGLTPGTVVITATLSGTATSTITVVAPPPPPPPSSPLIWYKFENDVTDSSGNGNHGIRSGGTFVAGKNGNGWKNDVGGISKVTSPWGDELNPTTQDFTIAVWINIPTGSTGVLAGLLGPSNGTNRRMVPATNTGTWRQVMQTGTTTASSIPVTGGWHHVCIRNDSSADRVTLWIDGVAGTGGATKTYTSFTFLDNIKIGEPNDLVQANGYIYDDFKVWTSLQSCPDDFNAENPPPPPPTSGNLAVTATQFYGVKTVSSSLLPLASANTSVRVPQGGAFAQAFQLDCTVANCSPRSLRLFYSCVLCPSGGSAIAVPNQETEDGISFFGTADEAGVITGSQDVNLVGSYPNIGGATNSTADATPSIAMMQNNSSILRYVLQLSESAQVDWSYCFVVKDQTGQPLDGHTTEPGTCITATTRTGTWGP
ncbi:MAG: right-handed parallel beta-helix repeat-containing protein [Cetobacterium sp.]